MASKGRGGRRPSRGITRRIVRAMPGRRSWLMLLAGIAIGMAVSVVLAQIPPKERLAAIVEHPGGVGTARKQVLAAPTAPVPPPVHRTSAPLPALPGAAVPQVAHLPPATETPPDAAAATPAWLRNAVPTADPDGRPEIAIVIDDMGLDRANSARVVRLPGPVTLSYMTYAPDLEQQTGAARAAGHELMVHVPMEPLDPAIDPGPKALLTGLPRDELLDRLRWDLSRFDGFVGINNHMGSKFTRSKAGMSLVLQEVKARGLLFLDSRTIGDSVAGRLAGQLGVPHLSRDVFLDDEISAAAVRIQLEKVERLARKRGYAVAIGHPHPGTIEALSQWLPTLSQRGFRVVPVTAILRRNLAIAG